MNTKTQDQLLDEFSQELNQMSSEDLMKEIYEELKRESSASSDAELLPANNSGSIKQLSNWIDQRPGKKFLDQYKDSPAVEHQE